MATQPSRGSSLPQIVQSQQMEGPFVAIAVSTRTGQQLATAFGEAHRASPSVITSLDLIDAEWVVQGINEYYGTGGEEKEGELTRALSGKQR